MQSYSLSPTPLTRQQSSRSHPLLDPPSFAHSSLRLPSREPHQCSSPRHRNIDQYSTQGARQARALLTSLLPKQRDPLSSHLEIRSLPTPRSPFVTHSRSRRYSRRIPLFYRFYPPHSSPSPRISKFRIDPLRFLPETSSSRIRSLSTRGNTNHESIQYDLPRLPSHSPSSLRFGFERRRYRSRTRGFPNCWYSSTRA